MKVRYTDTAATEVGEILEYIARHNRSAAVQINSRLTQTVIVLADFPEIAQMSDEPGVRRDAGRAVSAPDFLYGGERRIGHPACEAHGTGAAVK